MSSEQLFLKEAKNIGKLIHPNIALTYDVTQEQGLCFIAREYIAGEQIKVTKLLNKKIDCQNAFSFYYDISKVLSFTNEMGIVHGKLNPNNIFILNKIEIKLTDFQFNNFQIPVKLTENISLNNLSYLAPEQIEKNKISAQSDIYSLGIILYELLTDHNPFYHNKKDKILANILNKTPEVMTKYNSDLPAKLNQIVFKAIEKIPDKRYKSMVEFGDELKRIIVEFEI